MYAMPSWIIPSYELWVMVQIVIYMYHAEVRDGPSDHNRKAENKQPPEVASPVEKYVWFLLNLKVLKNILKFSERQTEMS